MQCFGFEVLAQHGIDALLTLDAAQPCECLADDHRFKMTTIASDGKMIALKAGADPAFNLLGGKHDVSNE